MLYKINSILLCYGQVISMLTLILSFTLNQVFNILTYSIDLLDLLIL